MLLTSPLLVALGMNPAYAVGVVLPLLIAGDIFCSWRFFGHWDAKILRLMIPGAALGVLLASPLLAQLQSSEALFNRWIGGSTLLFALVQLALDARKREPSDRPLPHQTSRLLDSTVGFCAGTATAVVSTIAHQGGAVSNLYLLGQGLAKEQFVATATGLYFTLNCMKVVPYVEQGMLTKAVLLQSLVGMPFVVLGGFVGAKLLRRLDPVTFGRFILVFVLIAGGKLLIQGH
jgi:uncharacterized membrane protein YfcA